MSTTLIQGQKYESLLIGFGVPDKIETSIFIPNYELNLSQNGTVQKTKKHRETLAAYTAFLEVHYDFHNSEKYRDREGNYSGVEYSRLIAQAEKEADRTALTSVQIPKDLLDQIKGLHEESVAAHTEQNQMRRLNSNINKLIQSSGIFNEKEDSAKPVDVDQLIEKVKSAVKKPSSAARPANFFGFVWKYFV